MSAYIITLQAKHEGHVHILYTDGLLQKMELKTDINNANDLAALLSKIPLEEQAMQKLASGKKNITKMPDDLSFSTFWDMYDFKYSSKKKCQKIWESMTEADQTLALAKLPRFKQWQSRQTSAHPYAETWLSQRRYENEYR